MNVRCGRRRGSQRRSILQQRNLKLLTGDLSNRRDGYRLGAATGLIIATILASRTRAMRANALDRRGAARQSRLAQAEQQAKEYGERDSHFGAASIGSRLSYTIGAIAQKRKGAYLAAFSAFSIFLTNLAESLLKSFRQPLQQSLISRPSCVNTYGSPISPSFSSETGQVFRV